MSNFSPFGRNAPVRDLSLGDKWLLEGFTAKPYGDIKYRLELMEALQGIPRPEYLTFDYIMSLDEGTALKTVQAVERDIIRECAYAAYKKRQPEIGGVKK